MKGLAVVLCFAVLLVFAGAVSAQINPPEKDNNIEKSNSQEIKEINEAQTVVPVVPAPNANAATKVKMKKMSGTVVSVDAVANTMVVKAKKNSMTFAVDPNATIMWAGNTVKLADVPKDGKIVIMYKMDGKMRVATSIMDQPTKSTMPPKTETPKQPTNPNNH